MKTIEYVEGMVVSEPCIVKGMPIEVYHGKSTATHSISSSGLRTIEAKSPAHYWARCPHNPERVEEEDKAHLNLGQAAHVLLLGEDGFRDQFSVRPAEFKDWRTNDSKEWRDGEIAKGKKVLIPDDLATIKGMAGALAKHPLAQHVLVGDVERSMFWKDKKTGVMLRARPDVLPSADGIVADFKTTTDASPEAVRRTISEYAYHMQGGLVGMGMDELAGVKMTDFVLVFQEKVAPWAILVTPIDQEWIYWGQRQLRRAIDKFAECLEKNEWPGYPDEQTTSMPDWLRKRFEFEDQNGLIPEAA